MKTDTKQIIKNFPKHCQKTKWFKKKKKSSTLIVKINIQIKFYYKFLNKFKRYGATDNMKIKEKFIYKWKYLKYAKKKENQMIKSRQME